MAFLWFGKKGKRERLAEEQPTKKELVFKHQSLEAAYYHSKVFSALRVKASQAAKSCAHDEGMAAIRCYLQYLCGTRHGGIKGTRSVPVIAKQVNSKETVIDAYTLSQLMKMHDNAETLYADLGISIVEDGALDNLASVISKLDSLCGKL